MMLAWGAKVSPSFATAVVQMTGRLMIEDPSWLMTCMAFETGEQFSPSVRNGAGSGAVGLIQFMPSTAGVLGTSTEELAAMTAITQLSYVEAYFRPRTGRLHDLGDVYGAILWPGMIGKTDAYPLFKEHDPVKPKLYLQNKGLDVNHDGVVTRGEVCSRINATHARGLSAPNVLEMV